MLKKSLLKIFSLATVFVGALPLHAQAYGNGCNDFPCFNSYSCEKQFWLEADYLYWQIEDSPKVIPLVIEQPIVDGPFDIVLGGKKIKNDWHSGARFAFGYWFDNCKSLGAEVSYFFLGKNSKNSSVAADENGSPRLRVPYFNVTTGLPDSTALATPGLFRGSALLKVSNKMQGAELNLLKEIPSTYFSNLKILTGFRYWNFDDSLTFSTDSPLVAIPTIYNNRDAFRTHNNFYGAQIGVCLDQCYSSFLFNLKGKVALGAMCQKSKINGRFKTNEFTGTEQTFAGGYFALPTNIGTKNKTRFSVIPELNANLGYQITDCFSIHVGYSILYATQVLRASKQMSSEINPTQSANIEFTPTPVLVGEPSPKAKTRTSSLWAQGVNVGLDFTF